jgi:predicted RND superfamily exporter protein
MRTNPLARLLRRLGAVQVSHPWWVVITLSLTLFPAWFFASQLHLKTGFTELLPSDKPSVIEAERVNERLTSTSTLTVVAEAQGPEPLKKFVDIVGPRIRALGPEYVSGVDDGTRNVQAFFEKNKHLYADLEDIKKLHHDVIARYDYEVGKESGTDLDLLDEEDEPPKISADTIEKQFQKKVTEAKKSSPGVDGYYIGEEGKLGAILVRTPLGSGDERAFELEKQIRQIVDEEKSKFGDPNLTIGFTGNLITSAEQHRAVKEDLQHVGFWGVLMILGIVFAFFVRIRTVLAMTLTVGLGALWAFAVAQLTVGHLNMATGFLVSIIVGNGINFGIIYMARYLEARRDEHLPVPEAIAEAHDDTHTATLAAAGAAGIAYGSLAVTDFHGFKHFGIIGGAGMVLCWIATYSFLPSFLVLSERYAPMFTTKAPAWRSKMKGFYAYPFAMAARTFPRGIALLGALLGLAATVLAVRYFLHDPMEYDLANIRNERLAPTSAGRLSVRVDKIVGRLGQDGRAILTERLDQVKPLIAELERRRNEAPADAKPFDKVVSVYNLLPPDQDEKLTLLKELKDRIDRARKRGIITDADWKKLSPHIPAKLAPIGIDELPELVARPFTEKNGTRGTIVYIVPTEGKSVYDAHYLMRWADSFREVKLPSGEIIRGTGDPVVFSDMLINIGEDAPKAILLSLVGTLLVILVAFRGRASGWISILILSMGVVFLVAFLALRNIKLNFLNFVSLPITIGVGADYVINVMKRHDIEKPEDFYRAFLQTGGAVVLCSLTTQLGYFALLLSINRAVKSFGLASAVGEITTLLAAILVLPAFLFWSHKRKQPPASPSPVPEAPSLKEASSES